MPHVCAGMRIGLFGGSFDPPHAGHLEVSLAALRALRLDQVWWLVSPQNPLKPHAPSSDLGRRIAAARALTRHPRIKVTGLEKALGTNATSDMLAKLLPMLPGVLPVWMMGADNLAGFHRWADWRGICMSLPIAVFNRPGAALRALSSPAALSFSHARIAPADAANLAGYRAPAWVFLPSPSIAESSTRLRAARRRRATT